MKHIKLNGIQLAIDLGEVDPDTAKMLQALDVITGGIAFEKDMRDFDADDWENLGIWITDALAHFVAMTKEDEENVRNTNSNADTSLHQGDAGTNSEETGLAVGGDIRTDSGPIDENAGAKTQNAPTSFKIQ